MTKTQAKHLSPKWRRFPDPTVAKAVRMGRALPSPFPEIAKRLLQVTMHFSEKIDLESLIDFHLSSISRILSIFMDHLEEKVEFH